MYSYYLPFTPPEQVMKTMLKAVEKTISPLTPMQAAPLLKEWK